MQLIQANGGKLLQQTIRDSARDHFTTSMHAVDRLLPLGGFSYGSVHELLTEGQCPPWCIAALLAHAATANRQGAIIWSDSRRELYLPALSSLIPLDRLFVLRVSNPDRELAAICESLRCKSVAATIAAPSRLSRIETRRLQLAAERGNGIALLIRQAKSSSIYAAATRWRVRPALGNELVQRWTLQFIHGHGGQTGKSVLIEVPRDTINPNLVRAIDPMAHRQDQQEATRASA